MKRPSRYGTVTREGLVENYITVSPYLQTPGNLTSDVEPRPGSIRTQQRQATVMDLGGSDHLNGSDGINWISYKNALKCYPKYSKSKFTFEIQIEINMFYLRSLTSAIKIQLYNSQMSGNRRQ